MNTIVWPAGPCLPPPRLTPPASLSNKADNNNGGWNKPLGGRRVKFILAIFLQYYKLGGTRSGVKNAIVAVVVVVVVV